MLPSKTSRESLSSYNEETCLVHHQDEEGVEMKKPYPKSVFFIVSNEFCERFSYYGMKTILTIYLINYLAYSENTATVIYHVFSMACYFTPVIGAIISDSYLGKFKTIFYISIIYAIGNIVLAVSAVPSVGFNSAVPLTMLGLALIAFGTGGIKPCVAAFGGDQFGPGQEKQLERFFSIFYISINAGSLISTFITPILRADVTCFGAECFTLAFGLPAGLMVISLVIFLIGRPLYKVNPPEGNIIVEVVSCIGHALFHKSKDSRKRTHWLDHADDKYDKKLIEDIKAVLKVLFLYLPLPFFWALFDQQGSRWTIQATYMDGKITENFRMQPDQMQVVNPILIVACIPLFQFVIYPVLQKLRLVRTPLQKMATGGILAALAFVLAYLVELKLQDAMPVIPSGDNVQLNIINGLPTNCNLSVIYDQEHMGLKPEDMTIVHDIKLNSSFVIKSENCQINEDRTISIPRGKNVRNVYSMFITGKDSLNILLTEDELTKPEKTNSDVRIFYNLQVDQGNSSFILKYMSRNPYTLKRSHDNFYTGYTTYYNVDPQSNYMLKLGHEEILQSLNLRSGGRYIIYVNQNLEAKTFITVAPNSVSLYWQIPQYIVITFAEIMFSITGLEFSYSQAPSSMKSVMQAGWLMTTAFGDLIVVLVAQFSLLSQAYEFLLFAGLMVIDMIIFAFMAYYYKPSEFVDSAPQKGKTKLSDKKSGQDNLAYTDDTTQM